MSDWTFLESVRCVAASRHVPPQYVTDKTWGFCGMFRMVVCGYPIRCIASDGEGWKHVSVSIEGDKRCPKWEVMCKVKDLFWDEEDVVVQYHPAHSEYVNMHPGCLHLWQPLNEKMPTPPSIMVGYK